MHTTKDVLRVTLIVIAILCGVYALRPDTGSRTLPGDDPSAVVPAARSDEVKHVLRVVPGGLYMPGTTPPGAQAPLEGLIKAARAFENRFPDTRIEYTNVPASNREYLITQLSSQTAPDIIAVNVEDVWPDIVKGWYVPLDEYLNQPNPFVAEGEPGSVRWWDVFKYQAISRGKAGPDRRMYCISFDMVETAVYYNKTIFKELGLTVPDTWDAFLELQKTLAEAGYTPMLVSMDNANDWGADLLFDQVYAGVIHQMDLVNDSEASAYMENYLDADEIAYLHQKGYFTSNDPRYREVWRLMKQWRRYWNRDLAFQAGLSPTDRLREFVNGKGAMIWDTSMLVEILKAESSVDFEWDVFYFPPITPEVSPYANSKPFCVIGGAGTMYEVTNSAFADTGDIATSERLDRAIKFLQFITTPEVNGMIVHEARGLLPNIVGVEVSPEYRSFDDILKRDYASSKWIFTFGPKFADIQRRMLHMYLDGWIDLDELMGWLGSNVTSATRQHQIKQAVDMKSLDERWKALGSLRGDAEDPGNTEVQEAHEVSMSGL